MLVVGTHNSSAMDSFKWSFNMDYLKQSFNSGIEKTRQIGTFIQETVKKTADYGAYSIQKMADKLTDLDRAPTETQANKIVNNNIDIINNDENNIDNKSASNSGTLSDSAVGQVFLADQSVEQKPVHSQNISIPLDVNCIKPLQEQTISRNVNKNITGNIIIPNDFGNNKLIPEQQHLSQVKLEKSISKLKYEREELQYIPELKVLETGFYVIKGKAHGSFTNCDFHVECKDGKNEIVKGHPKKEDTKLSYRRVDRRDLDIIHEVGFSKISEIVTESDRILFKGMNVAKNEWNALKTTLSDLGNYVKKNSFVRMMLLTTAVAYPLNKITDAYSKSKSFIRKTASQVWNLVTTPLNDNEKVKVKYEKIDFEPALRRGIRRIVDHLPSWLKFKTKRANIQSISTDNLMINPYNAKKHADIISSTNKAISMKYNLTFNTPLGVSESKNAVINAPTMVINDQDKNLFRGQNGDTDFEKMSEAYENNFASGSAENNIGGKSKFETYAFKSSWADAA